MELGYRLKKGREAKRLSQQQIADLLGISQKTYSNYESCKSKPSVHHLNKLGRLLEINLTDELRNYGFHVDVNHQTFRSQEDLKNRLLDTYEQNIKDKQLIISLLQQRLDFLEKLLIRKD